MQGDLHEKSKVLREKSAELRRTLDELTVGSEDIRRRANTILRTIAKLTSEQDQLLSDLPTDISKLLHSPK